MSKSDETNQHSEPGPAVMDSVRQIADAGDRWFIALARGLGRLARIARNEGAIVTAAARAAAGTTKKYGEEFAHDLRDEFKRDFASIPFSGAKPETDLDRRERYLLEKLGAMALKFEGRLGEMEKNDTYIELSVELRQVRERIAAKRQRAPEAVESSAVISVEEDASAGQPGKRADDTAGWEPLDAIDATVSPANGNKQND